MYLFVGVVGEEAEPATGGRGLRYGAGLTDMPVCGQEPAGYRRNVPIVDASLLKQFCRLCLKIFLVQEDVVEKSVSWIPRT